MKLTPFMMLISLISTKTFIASIAGSVNDPATSYGDSFPTPPASATHLFYIQRSNNTNTVMYEANLRSNLRLDPENPVNVYWIRYAERGQRKDLSSLQWKMAYGYQHHQITREVDEIDIRLNAFKKKAIRIVFRQGKPIALASINGKLACLQKIFVQLTSSSGLIPKVDYIELFGTDPDKGHSVYERIRL